MSFIKSLGLIGGAALSATGPIGFALAAAINLFLPDDEKVTQEDTVDIVEAKYEKLSDEDKAQVATHYYQYLTEKVKSETGLKLAESNNNLEYLLKMEETDKNVMVRPNIADRMAWFVIAMSGIILFVHAIEVLTQDAEWSETLIGLLLFLPTWVVQKYFDRRSDDKVTKAKLLTNQEINLPERLGNKLVNHFTQ